MSAADCREWQWRATRGLRRPAGRLERAGRVDLFEELDCRRALGPCALGDLGDLRIAFEKFLERLDSVPLVDADELTNALGEPMVLYPRLFRIVISSSNAAAISDGLFGRFQI
ncbi:hypothetical protein [Rhodococcus opacus]|uniref:hypothetical protein n=1 Tax=Rhodococcus opacus TaxID=37919 RepID=UPI001F596B91|nr:hypothetical protein [Rhodococcus opacus]UNN05097.1 hypothetical protein MOO23_40000 [Rhodococcus opacus]